MSSPYPVRAHFSGITRALLALSAAFGLLVGLSPMTAVAAGEPVTGSIAGRVTDSSGPVADAQVCAYRTSAFWADGCETTGDDGTYRIDIVDGASGYTLKATRDGYVPTWYGTPASVADSASAAVLDLGAQPTRTGVDISLITGATITGAVTLDGTAVRWADVCLPGGDVCASTGTTGTYTIQVPPGSAKLTATWEDDWDATLKGSVQLTALADGHSYTADIALAPGTGLSGTVAGPDAGADEYAYATVYSLTADGDLDYVDEHYTVGSDQSYAFRELDPGTYRVKITADGYAPAWVGGSASSSVTVTANQILPVGHVVLTRLAPGNLTGNVLDSAGAALKDVTVTAERGSATVTATTAADGTFTLNSLAAGVSWQLSLSRAGYVTRTLSATPKASRTTTLSAVHLLRPSSVSGTVTDSTGHAISEATVYLSGPDTYTSAAAAADGSYSFTDLASGRYELYVSGTDTLLSATKQVSLGEGKSLTQVALVLAVPATISGAIADEHGNPVEGAVQLYRSGDDPDDSYAYDWAAGGDFSFDRLPAGTYTISASSGDYQTTWLGDVTSAEQAHPTTVAAGDSSTGNTITLRPRGGATLSGTVKTADGATASGVQLALATRDDEGGDWDYADNSDEAGKYTIGHLDSGDYSFVVSWDATSICGPGYAQQCTPASVTMAGQDRSVDVTLPSLGSVSGSVTGPAGVTGGADVYLTDATGREIVYDGLDSGDDSYRLEHIPYGTYTLTLEPEGGARVTRTVVVDGDETVELAYSAGYSISGTVSTVRSEGWITVRAVDAITGETVASADVRATRPGDFGYAISGLPAGDYRLFLNADSQSFWYPNETSRKTATIVTVTDADRSGFDFAVTSTGAARVSGRLILPAGVVADSGDDYPELRFVNADNGYTYYPSITDDGGYGLLLPLGSYQVTVFRSEDLGTIRLQQNVQVAASRTLDLTLAPGGSLSGRVVDSDGVGVEDAEITATSADGQPATTYADQWGYWKMAGAAPNANTLRISADGYRTATPSGSFVVSPGQDTDTGTVTLTAAGQLRVRLPYLKGEPRVTIVVTDAGGSELARRTAYADNDSHTLSGLPVGEPLLVRFEGKGITPEWWRDQASADTATPVTLNADSITSISPVLALTAVKPGTIRGTVTNATGEDGTIWIVAVDGDDSWTATAAADGTYSLDLQPGTEYKVRAAICLGLWMGDSECLGTRVLAWHGGLTREEAAEVTVVSEQSTTVDLTLGDTTPPFTQAPSPTIAGDPTVGSTLTVAAGTWEPAPDVPLAYQWLRGGHDISGATDSTYTLVGVDAGSRITVKVTATKSGYRTTSRTSDQTLTVLDLSSGAAPVITGTAQVGKTLTASDGGWPAGGTLTRQWKSGGAAVGTGASSYVPVAGDVGRSITVTVTWSKTGYPSVSRTSAASSPVAAAPAPVPPNLDFSAAPTPTVSGTAKVGSTLTAGLGAWAPAPVTLAVQWLRGGVAIPGATKATYKVAAADAGLKLTVQVTGSKAGYNSVVRVSAATKAVPYLGTTKAATPKISGTAKVGKTLKAKAGTWKPKGFTFTYQWYRSGAAISGATKTSYKLTAADKGKKLTVKVTGKKAGYASATKTSKATGKVK